MFGLEYVHQAQEWLKEDSSRDILLNYNGKSFTILITEAEKTVAVTTGDNLADAVKNVSDSFKKKL